MRKEIPVNNPAKFIIAFVDESGTAFDPISGIQIKILSPSGVQTTLLYPNDLTRESAGVYSVVHEVNESGDWVANGEGVLPDGKIVTTDDIVQPVERSSIKF